MHLYMSSMITFFSIKSDRDEGAEVKPTKKKTLEIYLDNLLKKRTQFLKRDNVEGGAATSSTAAHDDDDNAAPSEATVIIEDEPPRKVIFEVMLSDSIQSINQSMNFNLLPFQDEKSLVYAELMLKPSSDGTSANPSKHSTEYAEIVYVSPNLKAADKK